MPNLIVTDPSGKQTILSVATGSNLREVLLQADISPYATITQKLNCGGNGICATCGVIIREEIPASHWHDKLAKRFRYPRLSCQITVTKDLSITIPKKMIWGDRIKKTK